MSETLALCKAVLRGNQSRLMEFLSNYGEIVKRVVKDGVICKDGTHYVFSTNSGCTGCDLCSSP